MNHHIEAKEKNAILERKKMMMTGTMMMNPLHQNLVSIIPILAHWKHNTMFLSKCSSSV